MLRIFVFKNVSSTEAEKPLLEIPAFAVIETIDDTGLQDCEKMKTKKYEILSFLSQLKPPFYQHDLQGLQSPQIPFFQLFSLHDYNQFASVSG